MGRADDLLEALVAEDHGVGGPSHVERVPPRAGDPVAWPDWADPSIVDGYRSSGVERPWRHQAEAAEAAWGGRHTVLSTSTGSGKSLAFWLPALTAVRAGIGEGVLGAGRIETVRRRGSVLYLCPTKALAADQLAGLDRLLTAARSRDVRAATCDGDTPPDERRWVREHADVVLTNPDFLHFSLLPGHRRWIRLLRSLRYVVIDEAHAYRGVFGAHVSLVLRRLRRVAEHYGARPVFIAASATSAEPARGAARLIGVDPEEIESVARDTSPAGARTFALWQPDAPGGTPAPSGDDPGAPGDTGDTGDGGLPEAQPGPGTSRRPATTTSAARLLAALTRQGARTLVFARSRRGAESIALIAQDELRADPSTAELSERIAAYRGGYLPEERRELERSLRTGELLGLATTNALELGIDVSGLDAVVVVGWPGTRMSLWQQAGRAGRAGSDGLAVLLAREDPLDAYLVAHPDAVFAAPLEATVFDPENPYTLAPHLCAAAAELPLTAGELDLFGPQAKDLLDVLVRQGALRRRDSGWFWTHPQPASGLTDLRGTGGAPVQVVESVTGRLLGTVDTAAADSTVHDGAVYVHQGRTHLVDRYDPDDGVALVTREDVEHRTYARWITDVRVRDQVASREWGPIRWGLGPVDVTTQVVGYQVRRLPGLEILANEQLDLPDRTLRTVAAWWTVPAAALEAAGLTPDLVPGALHAAEHASIGLLPLLATCDRWDLGGVSTALHQDTGEATVFVHDAYPGGAGFAERGFEAGPDWLRATRAAIAECPCEDGCPGCVQSPKCGNANSPLEKDAALRLLDVVLSHAPGEGAG